MKTKVHPRLRVNKEAIAVLTGNDLNRVAGAAADGKVHCCSRYTQGVGPSTTSSSVVM